MYRREEVKSTVARFIKTAFPEIAADAEESLLTDEITDILFDMLVGDFQEEE